MIYNEEETNETLVKGIEAVADVVGVTLGPARNSVIIDRPDDLPPLIINDGVTIARNISLTKEEMVGAKLLIEVCKRAQEKSGDGTTSASVLANALIKEGMKLIEQGYNPTLIRSEFTKLMQTLESEISFNASEITLDNIYAIALISANNDEEMAQRITEIIRGIGMDGVITVEPSHTGKDEVEIVKGFESSAGYIHNVLERVNGKERRMENPLVLVSDQEVKDFEEILPVLELAKENKRPLLMVLKSISPIALNQFVVNSMNGSIDASIAKAEDISVWTGLKLGDLATFLDSHYFINALDEDIRHARLEHLGECESLVINASSTLFIGQPHNPKRVAKRCEQIVEDAAMAETEFHKKKNLARMGKLNGMAGIIKIHGESEQEIHNKKDRLDDSLNAVRSAIQTGYTWGSGLSLLKYYDIDNNPHVELDIRIGFRNALFAVFNTLYKNCVGEETTLENVMHNLSQEYAYDGIQDEWYLHAPEYRVIDPAGVVCSSLRSAVSVAGYVLTAKRLIMRERHELDRRI
jgi:chaperonin GroEL